MEEPAPLPTGILVGLQVGMPRRLVTAQGKEWRSAIAKESAAGPVALGHENFDGDYQANRKYHGGPDKAVCAYAAEHYPEWNREFTIELPYGAFGENLTIEGLPEEILCVGDTLQAGTARLQISQPRQPCASVSKRWAVPALPRRMEETGWTGFYCRVLQIGTMTSGDTLVVRERPHPDWSLMRANRIMYGGADIDPGEIEALRALSSLSAEWKRILGRKLTRNHV